ncbi:MAG: DUF1559 domain-containing protein, partial [Pirellulaceae bacterium]|nr:DUF1559 domain-containing protein [Pirellulaceae bacterium]
AADTPIAGKDANKDPGKDPVKPATPESLAAHAKALSVVRADDFALLKFDLAAARQSQVLKDLDLSPSLIALRMTRGDEGIARVVSAIETIWVAIGPLPDGSLDEGGPPFAFGAYARFRSAGELKRVVADFGIGGNVPANHAGVQYMKPARSGAGPVFLIDGLDLYLATDDSTIHQVIDAKGSLSNAALLDNLAHADLDADILIAGSLGPYKRRVATLLTKAQSEFPVPVGAGAGLLPAQVDWGSIAVNFNNKSLVDVHLEMNSAISARQAGNTIEELLAASRTMLQGQRGDDGDGVSFTGLGLAALDSISVKRADQTVDLALVEFDELRQLPAIRAAAVAAAKQVRAINFARALGIAAANYEVAHNRPPENIKNETGDELLSWRVAILPFLDEAELYEAFDKKASWDSETNRPLGDRDAPLFFQTVESDLTKTSWRLLAGAPNGLLFLDAGERADTKWTAPEAFPINPDNPAAALGTPPTDGYLGVFRDGSVKRLSLEEIKAVLKTSPAKRELKNP